MSHCRIWVVSSKGGTGKSTLSVNLARAFAAGGQRVLLVDFDTTCRTLDMLLGVENTAVYDIGDVLRSRVTADKAAVRLPQSDNMYLIAGTDDAPDFGAATLDAALERAEREVGVTVTVIDTHAPDRHLAAFAACVTDTLVVTTPDTLSLRAADSCGTLLSRVNAPRPRMVINRFDFASARSGEPISAMIDAAGLRLVGVIPEDPAMAAAQAKGLLAKEAAHPRTVSAFRNVALRLMGEVVPLFSGFRGIDRTKFLA